MNTIAILLFSVLLVQDVPAFSTVWDGVYTDAQAARGKDLADIYCIECHNEGLSGGQSPPLFGDRFTNNWREGALDNLYNYMFTEMPAERPRRDLTEQSFLDMLAYILQLNGMPSGRNELTLAPLWTIMLVGKDGPKPVPSQAAVMTVGCLTQNPDNSWALTNALDPVRSKKMEETNPLEMKAYGGRPAGTLTFRLPNASLHRADTRKGQRVLVKGVLGRQSAGDRINVTLMETIAPSCGA